MELSEIVKTIGYLHVNTLDLSIPVPLASGQVLWFQYASWDEDGTSEYHVFDACLINADGTYVNTKVNTQVVLPSDGGEKPLVDETYPDYMKWLASVAGDGSTGIDEALVRTGSKYMRPLYDVALAACERTGSSGARAYEPQNSDA